ncbi:MAG: hypothetical protein P4L50_03590 [Anaerolineaceae bacterium]|nr:hypothetical protein [Anaerolineaceae bacterium]
MNDTVVPKNKGLPPSIRAHQRQTLWQVWVPLSLGILLVLVLAALTIIGANRGSVLVTKWSDLTSIIMIIPVLFIGLIILAIIGAAIYGIARALKILPAYTGLVQAYAQLISITVKVRSDQFLQPVFAVRGWLAALNRLWSIVRGKIPA